MRKLVYWAVSLLLLTACKKSTTSLPPGIQYKINGVQVQLTGGLDSTNRDPVTGFYYGCYAMKYSGSTFYTFVGENKNYSILLGVETQQGSLSTITYSGGAVDVGFTINDTAFGINHYGDGMSITISRYSNGTVDGTFSGTISDADSTQKNITQGQFNNLKVLN
jgi:hypothetical protein